jgi:hypothetical protein
MKGVMKMTIKKLTTLILALGILALASAFAAAGTPNQPALPDEIVAAIDSGALITLYDADGNVLYTSGDETAFDPALLDQVAEVVISDADGNVLFDLAVALGPNDKPVVQTDDIYFGLGAFLKEAGAIVPADGTGMQNQEQRQNQEEHQYKEEHQDTRQTMGDKDEVKQDCQDSATDKAAHHGSGKTKDDSN